MTDELQRRDESPSGIEPQDLHPAAAEIHEYVVRDAEMSRLNFQEPSAILLYRKSDEYTQYGIMAWRPHWVYWDRDPVPQEAAEAILAHARRCFRFDQENDQWYQWDGKRWRKSKGTATQASRQVANWGRRQMNTRHAEAGRPGEYGNWEPGSAGQAFDLLGPDKIASAILDQVRMDTDGNGVVIHEWDKKTLPHEYWGGNVLWDLDLSGRMRALAPWGATLLWCTGECDGAAEPPDEHGNYSCTCPEPDEDRDPSLDITHRDTGLLPAYGTTPRWDEWLAVICPNDADRVVIQCALALGLIQKSVRGMVIFLGQTGTGKTATMKMLAALLGEYAKWLPAATLFGNRADPQYAAEELKGVSAGLIDEGITHWNMSDEVLKMVTGGQSKMNARKRFHESEQVDATHTLYFGVNPGGLPNLSDPAILNRVTLIPFTGDPSRVRELAQVFNSDSPQFKAESSAILGKLHMIAAMIVAGMDVPVSPNAMRYLDEAKAEQALESTVASWIAASTYEKSGDGFMSTGEMYDAYAKWCGSTGQKPVPAKRFGMELSALGFENTRQYANGAQVRGWKVIRGEIEA